MVNSTLKNLFKICSEEISKGAKKLIAMGVSSYESYFKITMACQKMLYEKYPEIARGLAKDLELVWVFNARNKEEIINIYK